MKTTTVKAVYIEWADAFSNYQSWVELSDAKEWASSEDWIVKQTGFILKETKEYILLASKLNPHTETGLTVNVSGVMKLPKTWIRKRIDVSQFIS